LRMRLEVVVLSINLKCDHAVGAGQRQACSVANLGSGSVVVGKKVVVVHGHR